jgi:muramidase (phage lysozyme)
MLPFISKHLMAPLGLAATAGLAGATLFSSMTLNSDPLKPAKSSFYLASEFVQNSLFLNPYENLYNQYGQQYSPKLQGRFSHDYSTFFQDGNFFKPISVSDDTYALPSFSQSEERQRSIDAADKLFERDKYITPYERATYTSVGALSGLALTGVLYGASNLIVKTGDLPTKNYTAFQYLFESEVINYNKSSGTLPKPTRYLPTNFMPATIGALTGYSVSGTEGAVIGTMLGSYIGGYLLMKEEYGPQLKPLVAGALYGALAANIILDSLKTFTQEKTQSQSFTSSSLIKNSGIKSRLLNQDFYKSSNPYSFSFTELKSLVDSSVTNNIYYTNFVDNTYSPGYKSVKRLNFKDTILSSYKPNYSANKLYRIEKGQKSNELKTETNVFDFLKPLPTAISASFFASLPLLLTAALGTEKADSVKKEVNKGLVNFWNIFGAYEARQANIKAQGEIVESSKGLLSSLNEGKLSGSFKSTLTLGKSTFNYFRSEVVKNLKAPLPIAAGALVYSLLSTYQYNRSSELVKDIDKDYIPSNSIKLNNAPLNILSYAALGGVVGGTTSHFLSKFPAYRKLSYSLPFTSLIGGAITGAAELQRANLINDSSSVLPNTLLGTTMGFGLAFPLTQYSKSLHTKGEKYLKGNTISSALFGSIIGAISGFISSYQFESKSETPSNYNKDPIIVINQAVAPPGTDKETVNYANELINNSRYLAEGMAVRLDNSHIFYDSGTIGTGLMSFLKGSKDNTLLGAFYELSSDKEFLGLLATKARDEGIVVSMGGNISFTGGLEGAYKSILNSFGLGGPGAAITYKISEAINSVSKNMTGKNVYKTLEEKANPNTDSDDSGARTINSLLFGGLGFITAPTMTKIISNIYFNQSTSGIFSNKNVFSRLFIGFTFGTLGYNFASTTLDSTPYRHIEQAAEYFAGTPIDSLKAYGLTIGKNGPNTKNYFTGNFIDHMLAMFSRTTLLSGIDVTNKTTPFALGYKYDPSKKNEIYNYILHSKFFVEEEGYSDRYFVSTGNLETVVQTSRGARKQLNYAIYGKDPQIAKDLRTVAKFVATANTSDDLSTLTNQLTSKKVSIGGFGSNSDQQIINLIRESKGQIYGVMPYASDVEIANAFVQAQKEGNDVTVFIQNPLGVKAGGSQVASSNFARILFEGGVTIQILPEDSTYLPHAKVIASKDTVHLGSHNFSSNSARHVIEASLQFRSSNIGTPVIQAIKRDIYTTGAIALNTKNYKEVVDKALSSKDYFTLRLYKALYGTSNLKENQTRISNKNDLVEFLTPDLLSISGIIDSNLNSGAVFLPTSIPTDYYSRHGFSAKPNIYQHIRYGLDKQSSIERFSAFYADFALQHPLTKGLGSYINSVFPNLYKPNDGLFTTVTKGLGRFLDTITGHYTNMYYKDLRQGLIYGTIKDYHKSAYRNDNRRGFFENTLSTVSSAMSTTVYSLAFYFGVTHSMSIARAKFEDIGTDYISQLNFDSTPDYIKKIYFDSSSIKRFSLVKDITDTLKTTSSTQLGKVLDQYYDYIISEAYSSTPTTSSTTTSAIKSIDSDIKTQFDTLRTSTDGHNLIIEHDIDSVKEAITNKKIDVNDSSSIAKFKKETFGVDDTNITFRTVEGRPALFNTVSYLRNIDNSHFNNIIEPIIRDIAIYDSADAASFENTLLALKRSISGPITLSFKEGSDYKDLLDVENFGYKRLENIATQLDKLASFIPANPLLYYKPYRQARGVTTLSQYNISPSGAIFKDSISLKSLIGPGFSGLTSFSTQVLQHIKTVKLDKFVSESFNSFVLQNKLIKTELKIAKEVDNLLKLNTVPVDLLQDLTDFNNSTLTSKSLKELSDNLKDNVGEALKDIINDSKLSTLILQYTQDYDAFISNTKFYGNDSIEKIKDNSNIGLNRTLRSILFSAGPILILDRLLDPHLMQNNGDLISQIFADFNLTRTKDDKRVSQIEFTGGIPFYIKYPAILSGFVTGGFALPARQSTHSVISLLNTTLQSRYANVNLSGLTGAADSSLLNEAHEYLKTLSSSSSAAIDLDSPVSKYLFGGGGQRLKLKFGYMGAFVGGSAALIATQTLFNLTALTLNFIKWADKGEGQKPSSEEMAAGLKVMSIIKRSLTAQKTSKKATVDEIASREVLRLGALNLTYGRDKRSSYVYTFSSQIPTPLFQATLVSKLDKQGNALTYGLGFQFFPILGSGSIPTAPFSISLRPLRNTIADKRLSYINYLSGTTSNEYEKVNEYKRQLNHSLGVSLLSLPGQFISVDKDTTLSAAINFLGATSYLSSLASKIPKSVSPSDKAFRYTTAFAFDTARNIVGYSQALTIALPNAFFKVGTSLLGNPNIKPLGPASRKLAPFILSYMYASGITAPEGSFSHIGSHIANPVDAEWYRFITAVAPTTLIYGVGLHQAKVFSKAQDMAPLDTSTDFISNKQRAIKNIYDAAVKSIDPKLVANYELPLIRTANLRLNIAARRIFSITSLLVAGGLISNVSNLKIGFLDIISDSQSKQLSEVERVLQGDNSNLVRYRPSNVFDAAISYADFLARSVTGIFGVQNLFYRDDPNAFLSLGGPFGISETQPNKHRDYVQNQASSADISGSKVTLAAQLASADFSMQLKAMLDLSGSKDKTSSQVFTRLFAYPRKDFAKISRYISQSEYSLIRNRSGAFQLAIATREYQLQHLKHQRPIELAYTLLKELYAAGRINSPKTRIPVTYTPLDSLPDMFATVYSTPSDSSLDLSTRITRLLKGFTSKSSTFVALEDIAMQQYKEMSSQIPFIGYFIDNFKDIASSISGNTTASSGFALALQAVPLATFALGGVFSVGSQLLTSLYAVQTGNILKSSRNELETVRSNLERIKKAPFGYDPTTKKLKFNNTPINEAIIDVTNPTLLSSNIQTAHTSLFDTNFIDNEITSDIQEISTLKNSLRTATDSSHIASIKSDIETKTLSLKDKLTKKLEYFLDTDINIGPSKSLKVSEVLQITSEVKDNLLSKANNILTELTSIIESTQLEEVLDPRIKRALGQALIELHKDIYSQAHLPPTTKPNVQTSSLSSTVARADKTASIPVKNLNSIIQQRGITGLVLQSSQGAFSLASKFQDLHGPYEVLSGLTLTISSTNRLQKYQGAYAASSGLITTAAAFAAMLAINSLGVSALPLMIAMGLGVWGFTSWDSTFNNKRFTRSALSTMLAIDKAVFDPVRYGTANLLYNLPTIPILGPLSHAPFSLFDSFLNNIYSSSFVSENPNVQMGLSFILPETPQRYDLFRMSKVPNSYTFAGPRQEILSYDEYLKTIASNYQQNVQRAASYKPNIDPLVHPYLQGSVYTGNPFVDEPYLSPSRGGGRSRLLSKFANPPAISNILRIAIGLRSSQSDFDTYGASIYRSYNKPKNPLIGFGQFAFLNAARAGFFLNNNIFSFSTKTISKASSLSSQYLFGPVTSFIADIYKKLYIQQGLTWVTNQLSPFVKGSLFTSLILGGLEYYQPNMNPLSQLGISILGGSALTIGLHQLTKYLRNNALNPSVISSSNTFGSFIKTVKNPYLQGVGLLLGVSMLGGSSFINDNDKNSKPIKPFLQVAGSILTASAGVPLILSSVKNFKLPSFFGPSIAKHTPLALLGLSVGYFTYNSLNSNTTKDKTVPLLGGVGSGIISYVGGYYTLKALQKNISSVGKAGLFLLSSSLVTGLIRFPVKSILPQLNETEQILTSFAIGSALTFAASRTLPRLTNLISKTATTSSLTSSFSSTTTRTNRWFNNIKNIKGKVSGYLARGFNFAGNLVKFMGNPATLTLIDYQILSSNVDRLNQLDKYKKDRLNYRADYANAVSAASSSLAFSILGGGISKGKIGGGNIKSMAIAWLLSSVIGYVTGQYVGTTAGDAAYYESKNLPDKNQTNFVYNISKSLAPLFNFIPKANADSNNNTPTTYTKDTVLGLLNVAFIASTALNLFAGIRYWKATAISTPGSSFSSSTPGPVPGDDGDIPGSSTPPTSPGDAADSSRRRYHRRRYGPRSASSSSGASFFKRASSRPSSSGGSGPVPGDDADSSRRRYRRRRYGPRSASSSSGASFFKRASSRPSSGGGSFPGFDVGVAPKVEDLESFTSSTPNSKLKIKYLETDRLKGTTIASQTVNSADEVYNKLTTKYSSSLDGKQYDKLSDIVKEKLTPSVIHGGNEFVTMGYVDTTGNYSALSVSYQDTKSGRIVTKIFYAEGTDKSVMDSLIKESGVDTKKDWRSFTHTSPDFKTVDFTPSSPLQPSSAQPPTRSILVLEEGKGIQELNNKAFQHSSNLKLGYVHWIHNLSTNNINLDIEKKSAGAVFSPLKGFGQQLSLLIHQTLHLDSFYKPFSIPNTPNPEPHPKKSGAPATASKTPIPEPPPPPKRAPATTSKTLIPEPPPQEVKTIQSASKLQPGASINIDNLRIDEFSTGLQLVPGKGFVGGKETEFVSDGFTGKYEKSTLTPEDHSKLLGQGSKFDTSILRVDSEMGAVNIRSPDKVSPILTGTVVEIDGEQRAFLSVTSAFKDNKNRSGPGARIFTAKGGNESLLALVNYWEEHGNPSFEMDPNRAPQPVFYNTTVSLDLVSYSSDTNTNLLNPGTLTVKQAASHSYLLAESKGNLASFEYNAIPLSLSRIAKAQIIQPINEKSYEIISKDQKKVKPIHHYKNFTQIKTSLNAILNRPIPKEQDITFFKSEIAKNPNLKQDILPLLEGQGLDQIRKEFKKTTLKSQIAFSTRQINLLSFFNEITSDTEFKDSFSDYVTKANQNARGLSKEAKDNARAMKTWQDTYNKFSGGGGPSSSTFTGEFSAEQDPTLSWLDNYDDSRSIHATLIPFDFQYFNKQFRSLLSFGKQKIAPGIISVSSSAYSFFSDLSKSSFSSIRAASNKVSSIFKPSPRLSVSYTAPRPSPTYRPKPFGVLRSRSHNLFRRFYRPTPSVPKAPPTPNSNISIQKGGVLTGLSIFALSTLLINDKDQNSQALRTTLQIGGGMLAVTSLLAPLLQNKYVQRSLDSVGYLFFVHNTLQTISSVLTLNREVSLKNDNPLVSTYRRLGLLDPHNDSYYYDIKSASRRMGSTLVDIMARGIDSIFYPANFFLGIAVSSLTSYFSGPVKALVGDYLESEMLKHGMYNATPRALANLSKEAGEGAMAGGAIGAAASVLALLGLGAASALSGGTALPATVPVMLGIVGGSTAVGAGSGFLINFHAGTNRYSQQRRISRLRSYAIQNAIASSYASNSASSSDIYDNQGLDPQFYPGSISFSNYGHKDPSGGNKDQQYNISSFAEAYPHHAVFRRKRSQSLFYVNSRGEKVPHEVQEHIGPDGTTREFVKLDITLRKGGRMIGVELPSFATGYAKVVSAGKNSYVSIYKDREMTKFLGRAIHIRATVRTGQKVFFGQIIGTQYPDGGNTHTDLTLLPETYDRYFKALKTGNWGNNLPPALIPPPSAQPQNQSTSTVTQGRNLLTPELYNRLTPKGKLYYDNLRTNPAILALADAVARAEGTDFRNNSVNFGYGYIIGGSNIELSKLNNIQHPFVAPAGHTPLRRRADHLSTASGRYQALDFVYARVASMNHNAPDLAKMFEGVDRRIPINSFSPGVQDLMFIYSLEKRGILQDVIGGNFSEAVLDKLSREYTSITITRNYGGHGTPEGRKNNFIRFLMDRYRIRQAEQLRSKTPNTNTQAKTPKNSTNTQAKTPKDTANIQPRAVFSPKPSSPYSLSPQQQRDIISANSGLSFSELEAINRELDLGISYLQSSKRKISKINARVMLSSAQGGQSPKHPQHPQSNPYSSRPTTAVAVLTPNPDSPIPSISLKVSEDDTNNLHLSSDPLAYLSFVDRQVFLSDINYFMSADYADIV